MAALLASDPREIGPYRLVGRIGTGGMGVVYLAEDRDAKRVALKVIRTELAADPAFRARFRRGNYSGPLRVASTTSATGARTVGNSNPRYLLRRSEL